MTQIDHIAIDKRHASSILDVRSMRGGKTGFDHFLVRAKFLAKISSKSAITTNPSKTHHIEALKEPEIAREYRKKLSEQLDRLDTTSM